MENMNKEQLLNKFDEKFPSQFYEITDEEGNEIGERTLLFKYTLEPYIVKQFIFETIIPEVLKSIDIFKLNEQNKNITAYGDGYEQAITDCNNHIKQKAKEKFNIDL